MIVVAGAFTLALSGCRNDTEVTPPSNIVPEGGAVVVFDGGGGIAPPPDGAALCPTGACNYQSGDGCPAGQACRPIIVDGRIEPGCQPAGSAAEGESCQEWDDCGTELICVENVCRRFCCGDATQGDWSVCADGQSCYRTLLVSVDGEPTTTGASLCFPTDECDVLAEGACSAGRACQLIDSRGRSACVQPGDGGLGDPCPCVEGFLCVGGACRRLCAAVDGGAEPFCPLAEGVCVHFDRDPEGVGECGPLVAPEGP